MRISLIVIMISLTAFLKAQYPFEKYQAMDYSKKGKWTCYDKREKENKMHWTMSFPGFYKNGDSLTVQLTTFGDKDTSLIRIFRNKKQVQIFEEPYAVGRNFGMLTDTVFFGDINGDLLPDIKILCWYGGCGTASLNERVIYLIQRPDDNFTKVSFKDMAASTRPERDLNNDGNYEIITMTLNGYEGHNYWTFNLYNFINGDLVCVNDKFDYPIMIQFLNRENHTVTDKVSKDVMKTFSAAKPDEYDPVKIEK